jgi:ribosomal protein S18 acetylase RimI-like enzyme
MIEIVPALTLDDAGRRRVVEVYADAFALDFAYFSRDVAELADAFEHMLVLDLFHVAMVEGEPAGLAACTDGRQQCVRPRGRELRRHFGLVKGTIAATVFAREFARVVPGATDTTASLEFVGTAPAHQGQGVATALLGHLLALPRYREYVLEDIADTNAAALHVYAKLGFVEYRRRRVRHTRRTGISHYISMKLVQD